MTANTADERETLDTSELARAALDYARRGLHVFPVWGVGADGKCLCGKPTCERDIGKHPIPSNGLHAATTDLETIRAWWKTHPQANIAIRTGDVSDLTVIDIDGDEGFATFNQLIAEKGEPMTPIAATGSGKGSHFFFRYNSALASAANVLGPGVDVRNDGGYVVAAPSRHRSGGEYKWLRNLDTPLAPLPKHLTRPLPKQSTKRKGTEQHALPLATVREMLNHVDPDDRDNWFEAGLIVAREFDRSDEAWETYNEWAARSDKYKKPGTQAQMRKLFYEDSLKSPGGGRDELSIGTLIELAKQGGWVAPPLVPHAVASGAPDLDSRLPAGVAEKTDRGLADRLLELWGHLFTRGDDRLHLYDEASGQWSPKDFSPRLSAFASRLVDTFAQQLADGGSEMTEQSRISLLRLIEFSARRSTISSVAELVQNLLTARTHGSRREMNPDPELLACANGVLNLRTGELRPARRDDYLTLSVGVNYDPAADPTAFHRVVLATMGGDEGMAEYVQRVIGYAATGYTREQALFIFWGAGSNGKNLVCDAIKSALGEYSIAVDTRVLSADEDSKGSNTDAYEKATYPGRRFGLSSEFKDHVALNESFIKSLTGDHVVKAREPYGKPFEFTPRLKPFILTNHRPKVESNIDAIWRRVHLIPFDVSFGTAQEVADGLRTAVADTGLLAEFLAPSGQQQVLRWIAEGGRKYLTDGGLRTPPAVLSATAKYRRDEDYLGQFLTGVCKYVPKEDIDTFKAAEQRKGSVGVMTETERLYISKSDLYKVYETWCAENGHRAISNSKFKVRIVSTRRFCDVEEGLREVPKLEAHDLYSKADGKVPVYRYLRLNAYGLQVKNARPF